MRRYIAVLQWEVRLRRLSNVRVARGGRQWKSVGVQKMDGDCGGEIFTLDGLMREQCKPSPEPSPGVPGDGERVCVDHNRSHSCLVMPASFRMMPRRFL